MNERAQPCARFVFGTLFAKFGKFSAQLVTKFGKFSAQLVAKFGKFSAQLVAKFGKFSAQLVTKFGKFSAHLVTKFGKFSAQLVAKFGNCQEARCALKFVLADWPIMLGDEAGRSYCAMRRFNEQTKTAERTPPFR